MAEAVKTDVFRTKLFDGPIWTYTEGGEKKAQKWLIVKEDWDLFLEFTEAVYENGGRPRFIEPSVVKLKFVNDELPYFIGFLAKAGKALSKTYWDEKKAGHLVEGGYLVDSVFITRENKVVQVAEKYKKKVGTTGGMIDTRTPVIRIYEPADREAMKALIPSYQELKDPKHTWDEKDLKFEFEVPTFSNTRGTVYIENDAIVFDDLVDKLRMINMKCSYREQDHDRRVWDKEHDKQNANGGFSKVNVANTTKNEPDVSMAQMSDDDFPF